MCVRMFVNGGNLPLFSFFQLTWEDMEKTETEMINAVLAMVLSLTDKQIVSIYLKVKCFFRNVVYKRERSGSSAVNVYIIIWISSL